MNYTNNKLVIFIKKLNHCKTQDELDILCRKNILLITENPKLEKLIFNFRLFSGVRNLPAGV